MRHSLEEIHAAIDDAAFAEAWDAGRKLSGDEAVTLALDSMGAAGATAGSLSPRV